MVSIAAPTAPLSSDALAKLEALRDNIASVIRDKEEAIRCALVTLLARGHLLIEDIPGVGKTTLARTLARSLGGSFRRIQFTSDLLPSDIVGVSVFNGDRHEFEFRPGPLFANVIIADEINRTTPRTQSALLEAMSDGQISIDNATHKLEQPFLVMATQNPVEHFGTYPLPESQMDRFLLRISLGYPSRDIEHAILRERGGSDPVDQVESVIDLDTVRELQDHVETVRVDDRLIEYAMDVIAQTRQSTVIEVGVSTRGALAWYRAAQAHALIDGRDYCIPDDFKDLAVRALAHRVVLASMQDSLGQARMQADNAIQDILTRVSAPR